MGNADKVAKKKVGMEGCVFIECCCGSVATIDLSVAESTELTVTVVLGEKG